MKIQTRSVFFTIILTLILAACGSANVQGPQPTGPEHLYTGTETVQVWGSTGLCFRGDTTFEKDSMAVTYYGGDAFYPTEGVTLTLNLSDGTLEGTYTQGVCPDTRVSVTTVTVEVSYETATDGQDVNEEAGIDSFVYAHGNSFPDYIVPNRDYRELSVDSVYDAVLARGFTDSDELVIAHSDEVRENQEANLQPDTYDTGKALILVGDIPKLKEDKAFMVVSSDVYSKENPGGPNLPLARFTP